MLVEEMLDQLETVGRRKTDRIIWETILYYYGSIMLNKYKFKKDVGSSENIKYYSIVFAGSGQGKSFSMGVIEKMCRLNNYSETMKSFYKQALRMLPEEPEGVDEVLRYMPKSVTIGVEGTAEGLFYVSQSQTSSQFGSLNLSTEEFGETISSSAGLLSKLKELYDGKFKAKIIKGDADSEMKRDIEDIICNFIGLGSRKGVTQESAKELKRIATSGMYRRTFIIESIKLVEKNTDEENITELKEYLDALNENFKADYMARAETDIFSKKYFTYEAGYTEKLEEIDDDLVFRAQNDQLNEFAQYNTGSLEMIIDLSHIIAFLEWDTEVKISHLEKAYKFMVKTRDSVEDTFKSIHPYKLMYDLLKLKENMTISEMAEYEHAVPIAATKVKDNIALLEELCYRKDEVLIKTKGKVTRYKIEKLPMTNMKKLIISTTDDKKYKMSINFTPGELAWELFPKLVTSKNIDSFTTCHYEPSNAAPEGHRRADNFLEGQNLISFDIDEGMTIDEAQEILHEYTYLIYTTKSHQKEKNGSVCDRFRILLPTKTKFYVTPEQHKMMYENLEVALEITSNDTQTRNVSRLFYTNPDAEVITHEGKLVDISCCIPSTEKSDKIMPVMENLAEQEASGELGRREAGYMKWFLMNTSSGNRHDNLTKAAYFFKDIGIDWKEKVRYLNNMLPEPMNEAEMKFIYSIK